MPPGEGGFRMGRTGLFLDLFDLGLELVELALEGVDRLVDGLFERLGLVRGDQLLAGHAERDGGDLVALFVVLVELEDDVGTRRAFRKAVQLRHLGIHEFDQPLVGVESDGLNLHVHSLGF